MFVNFIYVAFAVSLLCNVCQFLFSNESVNTSNVRRQLSTSSKQLSKAQTIDGVQVPAGTRKFFFDFGANDGASTSFFLQRNDKEGNIAIQGGEKDSFMEGLGETGDWNIVMFEANTNFTKQLNLLRDKAMSQGLANNVTVFAGTAISTHTGNITFIIDNPFSGSAGATTMPESTSAVGPHSIIPSVGIADLFRQMNIRQNDFVIVKMDIEGGEFDLLRYMVLHGLHTRIDILAVEYHHENYWVFGKTDEIREKYTAIKKCLDWVMEEITGMKIINWGR